MKLFIIRHGEAQGLAQRDELRSLTPAGVSLLHGLWKSLSDGGLSLSHLSVSPYIRAQQTADVIESYYPGIARSDYAGITPEDRPSDVVNWLSNQPVEDGWALVSHMPLVAALTGLLTDGEGSRIPFGTGTVACLDMEVFAPGGGRLLWQKHTSVHP